MYRQPADFPPDGYSEIDGCREPGFRERFGRGFHCSIQCLQGNGFSKRSAGGTPGFRENRPPSFRCSIRYLQGKPILRTIGGRSPTGFGRFSPSFYLFIREPGSRNPGPAASAEQVQDRPELPERKPGSPRRGCGRNGGGQGREPRIAPAAQREPAIQRRYPDPGGLGGGLEGFTPAQLGDHGQGGGGG